MLYSKARNFGRYRAVMSLSDDIGLGGHIEWNPWQRKFYVEIWLGPIGVMID